MYGVPCSRGRDVEPASLFDEASGRALQLVDVALLEANGCVVLLAFVDGGMWRGKDDPIRLKCKVGLTASGSDFLCNVGGETRDFPKAVV
eukprot:6477704-Amphidinium_carterae.1